MSHAQLINQWPSLTEFAGDLGVSYGTAKAMRRRDSVPPAYWQKMIEAAERRSIENITLERLANAAASRATAQPMQAAS